MTSLESDSVRQLRGHSRRMNEDVEGSKQTVCSTGEQQHAPYRFVFEDECNDQQSDDKC